MDSRQPGLQARAKIPEALCGVYSPVVVGEWEKSLASHPNREFAEYIIRGFRSGFRVGFSHSECVLNPSRNNMKLADENSRVVDEFLSAHLLQRQSLAYTQIALG